MHEHHGQDEYQARLALLGLNSQFKELQAAIPSHVASSRMLLTPLFAQFCISLTTITVSSGCSDAPHVHRHVSRWRQPPRPPPRDEASD